MVADCFESSTFYRESMVRDEIFVMVIPCRELSESWHYYLVVTPDRCTRIIITTTTNNNNNSNK